MTTLHDPAALPLVYPGPRVRREHGWCSNFMSAAIHPPDKPGIGIPTWIGGGLEEVCEECERRQFRTLTEAESQAAWDAAPEVELPPERIEEMVRYATGGKPCSAG
jgi:hypothetical protein